MICYLAGPMSGIPQFNVPAFEKATARLRNAGIRIISPVELDDEAVRRATTASRTGSHEDLPAGLTWSSLLARDLKIIVDEADAVIVLSGWWSSKGARQEVFTALNCGKPVFYFDGVDDMCRLSPSVLMEDMLRAMVIAYAAH